MSSDFVGVTATGLVGDKDEWTEVEDEESGAVEGFEEWGLGAMALPTKTTKANGKVSAKTGAPGKGDSASDDLGVSEADTDTAAADYPEDAKNAPEGDNWSWGAAWSAFTTAVQQVRMVQEPMYIVFNKRFLA